MRERERNRENERERGRKREKERERKRKKEKERERKRKREKERYLLNVLKGATTVRKMTPSRTTPSISETGHKMLLSVAFFIVIVRC